MSLSCNDLQKQQTNATSAALLGYARVSKAEDQDTAPQIEAVHAAGCQRVYEERVSGGRWDRPELHRLLDRLAPGDVLTVWKLDRLSRSLKDLLLILDKVEKAGAGFRSLTENIDSTTASGRMMMQMLGAFAEFERAMVRERTQAGLRSARAQGGQGGRQPKLSPEQQAEVLTMLNAGAPPLMSPDSFSSTAPQSVVLPALRDDEPPIGHVMFPELAVFRPMR